MNVCMELCSVGGTAEENQKLTDVINYLVQELEINMMKSYSLNLESYAIGSKKPIKLHLQTITCEAKKV